MLKKIALAISFLLLTSFCFAETCPTVKEIKGQPLNGWQAFDTENNQVLSAQRWSQFKESIVQFTMAEWADTTKEKGTIHCYYRDKDGSNLEAYLSKDNFKPSKNSGKYWYQVSGSTQCAAGMTECEFMSKSKLTNPQMAQKE